MDNVIDLAEYRERKKLDEPQGLTWLRAYVARNGRSQPGRPPRLLRPNVPRPYTLGR
jgi:hypothetical protein